MSQLRNECEGTLLIQDLRAPFYSLGIMTADEKDEDRIYWIGKRRQQAGWQPV